ncbi:hypothetical protein [Flavobacterium sp.]|uniref:hypothetical protein n=1 Tax=Flavobacterium sp. TaxID=239 RepID=UPI0039E6C7F9
MYAQNLQLETIDLFNDKADILLGPSTESIPTEAEVEEALAMMYQQAHEAFSSAMFAQEDYKMMQLTTASYHYFGSGLWTKIKEYFCKFLKTGSTASEIFDKIVEYILQFIPGGIFIKELVKKVIRYLLDKGYGIMSDWLNVRSLKAILKSEKPQCEGLFSFLHLYIEMP